MPNIAARYRDSEGNAYRRWLRRLALWQYALFTGATSFITCFVVITLVSADGWPSSVNHSWASNLETSAVLTLIFTAFYTWHRREDLRQREDSERHEDDGADDDGTAAPLA